MLRKFLLGLALLCGDARPALAQQTFNISVGYFAVRGEDARVDGDVLNANRSFLTFDVSEMSGASAGAEKLIPIWQKPPAGAGAPVTRRKNPTGYPKFFDTHRGGNEKKQPRRAGPATVTVFVLPLWPQ